MAQLIDPWGGFNSGLQNLNDSLSNIRKQKVEDQLMESRSIENKTAAMKLQSMLTQQAMEKGARAAAASAQPTTETKTQFIPDAPAPVTPTLDVPPIGGSTTPTLEPTPTPEQPMSVFNTPGTFQDTTTTKPANRIKAQIDFYNSQGDVKSAEALKGQVAEQAKQLVDITGDPMAGLQHINDSLGTEYNSAKVHSYEILKNGDQPVAIFDKSVMAALQGKGVSPSEAAKQAMIPLNLPGDNGKIVSAFLANNPNPTPQQMWDLANKNNIPLKQIEPIITEIQKAQAEAGKSERQDKQFQQSEERQAKQFAHSDAQQAKTIAAIATRIPANSLQGFDENGQPIIFNRRTGAVSTGTTTNPTLGGAAADYTANKRALANDERQYDLMDKSERQAAGAAKLLRASSEQYKRTNVKFVNSIEALGREAVNDPKLADLQMKLLAFSREYYKVTTNAYASAAELSVGAQQQADKMLNASNSYAALEAKISAAEQEMSNTKKTFKQTIQSRKVQLNSPGAKATTSVDTSKPVHNGKIQGFKQSDGSIVDATGKRLN